MHDDGKYFFSSSSSCCAVRRCFKRTMAVACQTTNFSMLHLHAFYQEKLSLTLTHTHFIIHWPYIEFDIAAVTSRRYNKNILETTRERERERERGEKVCKKENNAVERSTKG